MIRKNIQVLTLLLFTLSIVSCSGTQGVSSPETQKESFDYKESAVVWQQTSAEYDALCYQAYNIAKLQLQDVINNDETTDRPLAIIMDLDETVIDNSPYNGKLALEMKDYSPESWAEWVRKSNAELIPGAGHFIEWLSSTNISLFFISNRLGEHLSGTLKNLENLGINISENHVMLKNSDESGKANRRGIVLSNYDVVMLIGDNLADFDNTFEDNLNISDRKELTKSFEEKFGSKFIVLPNVMYGDWEKTLKSIDPKAIQQPELEGNKKFIKSY